MIMGETEGPVVGRIPETEKDIETFAVELLGSSDPQVRRVAAAYSRRVLAYRAERAGKAAWRNLALTDPLTHVSNRRYFMEKLGERLGTAEYPVAVIWLDLDGFKAVNDTYGHAAGDYVLKAVAALIRSRVRGDDEVARIINGGIDDSSLATTAHLGGDEFAVIVPYNPRHAEEKEEMPMERQAYTVAERLQQAVRELPDSIKEYEISELDASIGFAVYDPCRFRGCMTAEELSGYADRAMYVAKRHGSGICSWEDSDVRSSWEEGSKER